MYLQLPPRLLAPSFCLIVYGGDLTVDSFVPFGTWLGLTFGLSNRPVFGFYGMKLVYLWYMAEIMQK